MANQKYKIELTALDKTKKAFGNVKKGLGSVKNAAVGVTKVIGGTAIAFAAVATTLAVVAKKSFDFADAIGKVSTRTGIATDTIQAFQIAAVLAGGSTEGANTALEKFARSVGDAQRGLKTMKDIFSNLGVEIKDVNGNTKSLDVLLREVTQAMSELESQSGKATVAANLFGRQGIKLLGAIDSLGVSLDEFIVKAKDFGLILDQDSIKKSELFNDTLFVLTRQFKILVAELSIAFLPIFQKLAATFVLANKEFGESEGGVKSFAEEIRDNLLNGFLTTLKVLNEFLKSIGTTRSYFNTLSMQLSNIGTAFSLVGSVAAFSANALSGNWVAATQAANTYNSILKNGFIDVTEETRKFNEENANATDALDAYIFKVEEFINDALEPMDEETKKLVEELFGVNDALNQVNNSVEDAISPFTVYRQLLNDSQKQTEEYERVAVKAFKGAEDALTDFVMKGKADFKKLVQSIIADLVRLAIRQKIIAPLFNTFDNFLGGFNTTPTTSTSSGGFTSPLRAEGGGFTGMGNRTGGLDGKGGFPAILHPNETVIDHHKGQQVAQQAVNVNFSIQATDASGFDEMLTARKNQIVAMISQAMNQKGKVGLI
tara:strand:+ start:346 stop:2151 length:1806 start_codon:yes stop_codon:yes gene_type:complete